MAMDNERTETYLNILIEAFNVVLPSPGNDLAAEAKSLAEIATADLEIIMDQVAAKFKSSLAREQETTIAVIKRAHQIVTEAIPTWKCG